MKTLFFDCSSLTPSQVKSHWERMIPSSLPLRIIDDDHTHADYIVIINSAPHLPPIESLPLDRTFMLHMEPDIQHPPYAFGDHTPDTLRRYCRVYTHGTLPHQYQPVEWHIQTSFDALLQSCFTLEYPLAKPPGLSTTISSIVSNKCFFPGHKLRHAFTHRLIHSLTPDQCHVYGTWTHAHLGPLPDKQKENGLVPYRYHLAIENHAKPGYFTEKLVDAILCECLVFYWGCPNLDTFLPPRCCIQLSLDDITVHQDQTCNMIRRAMTENWYEQYLPQIRIAKLQILGMSTFPRLMRDIQNIESVSEK